MQVIINFTSAATATQPARLFPQPKITVKRNGDDLGNGSTTLAQRICAEFYKNMGCSLSRFLAEQADHAARFEAYGTSSGRATAGAILDSVRHYVKLAVIAAGKHDATEIEITAKAYALGAAK